MTDTIGHRLKEAREHRHLTIEKVAEATRIRQGYLRALEADDFSAMPSPVQARGFLRNYSQYLELDLDEMVEELRANQLGQKPETELEILFEAEPVHSPPIQREMQPKVEGEEISAEAPAEPFWQTWLRRAKSEVGEAEAVPATEGVTETGAGQTVESEAAGTDSKDGKNTRHGNPLIGRILSYFTRKQAKPALEAEPIQETEPNAELEPQPEPVTQPAIPSQEIINEIGMQLRHRREMLSLTLDEIERHTRLRAEIMAALEAGNFDDMPSPVQTRGMLANYAAFLDLEVDALLLRFADALQARYRERHPENLARRRGQPIVPKNIPAFRTFIAGDVVFGIGMVLLLVGFSAWGISRVIAVQSEQNVSVLAEATGPSISEALIGTPVETVVSEVTLIPVEDTPIPELPEGTQGTGETFEIPTLATNANVQVNIVALERSFLRVTVDGELAFEGRTIPGNAYPFEAEQSVEILAGNGSALRIIYNQRDMGLLGGFGQIVSFIYTADEILIPTPAMSPTVTITPFISPTPTITPTPTISPSPTFTPGDQPVDL